MDEEAVSSDAERGAAAGGTTTGPELIDDGDAPVLSPYVEDDDETKKKRRRGNIEQIHDDVGPPPVVPMVASREDDFSKKTCGMFVPSAEDRGKKKAAAAAAPRSRDSLSIPTEADIEGGEADFAVARPRGDSKLPANRAVSYAGNAHVIRPPPTAAPDTQRQRDADAHENAWPTLAPHHQSTQLIPEAFLVEESDSSDGEVIIATPALPWWKQRRVQYALSAVFVVTIALAIALGSLVGRGGETEMPTLSPSAWPSASLAPSSPPSTCALTISSDRQQIDLQIEKAYEPKVAVDGGNMGVVVDDEATSTTYTIFFALKGDEWIIRNAFRMGHYSVGWNAIALDGTTAFVGLPEVGQLSVYEQNEFGFWEKVEDPFAVPANATEALSSFISSGHFGSDPGVDGDLACIGAAYATYFFRREGRQWVPFDSIEVDYHQNQCSISGDTIAIYGSEDHKDWSTTSVKLFKYVEEQNRIEPIQDPIPLPVSQTVSRGEESWALSGDYLLLTNDTGSFLYKREGTNETFAPHQQLNTSAGYIHRVAFDGDILVFESSFPGVYVFVEQNGYWEEVLMLERPTEGGIYDHYQLSGRSLLATWGSEVYAMNVERCAPTPTQRPSMSIAPTICHPLEITIFYDMAWIQTSWDMRKVGGEVFFQYGDFCPPCQGSRDCYTRVDTFCLAEGEYQFTIYDAYSPSSGGSPGLISPGHYNISSDGSLIAHGGAFEFKDTRTFHLPLGTSEPSSSLQPSALPSFSLEPTETCEWVTILISYDDYPEETSYTLQRIGASGLDGVKRHSESAGAVNHTQNICLRDGSYNLTIYDSAGDGIFLPGYYAFTSPTGEVIARGGENFAYSETTIFAVPFPGSPSEAPSTTQSPSSSQNPSAIPSLSMPPSKSGMPTRTPKPSPWPTYEAGTPWEEQKWWTHYPTGVVVETDWPTTEVTPFPSPEDETR